MTTTVLNRKISEAENKILDNSKYTTTQKLYKLTAEDFAARLKQADLVNKTDFDKKLASVNRQITSNKTKGVFNSKLKPLYTAFLHSFLNLE